MKIKVENLGSIHHGEIDLDKNLTVFVGGNNAGKSYMAYLVYGVFKSTNKNSLNDNILKNYKEEIIQLFEEKKLFDKFFNKTGFKLNLNELEKILNSQSIYSKMIKKTVTNNIPEIFASEKIKPNISIIDQIIFDFENIETFSGNNIGINGINYKTSLTNNNIVVASKNHKEHNNFLLKAMIPFLLQFQVNSDFYFFPAERSAINLFSKEIFKEKALERDAIARQIQNEDDIEALVKSLKSNGSLIPRYPLAISDYLYFVDDLPHITNQPVTKFNDLATEIEQILEGKVSISGLGDIQFKPKGGQENLALHLSASMIKSLSGLVFYLRHLAKEKDIIIIDEPELNLHPQNQILLTRVLAKMANRGIKIIFSTHSDYIISELSNLLILSKQFDGSEMLKQKYGYDNAEILTADKVNVFAFQNNTIEAIPITEQGIEVDKIEKVITDLNQRTNDIYYSYLESLETTVNESR